MKITDMGGEFGLRVNGKKPVVCGPERVFECARDAQQCASLTAREKKAMRLATRSEIEARWPQAKKSVKKSVKKATTKMVDSAVRLRVGGHWTRPLFHDGRVYPTLKAAAEALGTSIDAVWAQARTGKVAYATRAQTEAAFPGAEVKGGGGSEPAINVVAPTRGSNFFAFAWPDGAVTLRRPGWDKTFDNIGQVPGTMLEACAPTWVN